MTESRPRSLLLGKSYGSVASLPLEQALILRVVSFHQLSMLTGSTGRYLYIQEIGAHQSKAVGLE